MQQLKIVHIGKPNRKNAKKIIHPQNKTPANTHFGQLVQIMNSDVISRFHANRRSTIFPKCVLEKEKVIQQKKGLKC